MFKAAERMYRSDIDLRAVSSGEFRSDNRGLSYWVSPCVDVYGRAVLHVSERFPTFDSWDALYEDRYYHWYYIRHQGGLTMVYTADDNTNVRVEENIVPEKSKHAEILHRLGWI